MLGNKIKTCQHIQLQHCSGLAEFISPSLQSPIRCLVGSFLFSGTSEPSTEFTASEKLGNIS